MIDLPEEFFEWICKMDEFNDAHSIIRYSHLPQTCQLALIVEWLEVEKNISVEVNRDYSQRDSTIRPLNLYGYTVLAERVFREGSITHTSRNEALIAGIQKALVLI